MMVGVGFFGIFTAYLASIFLQKTQIKEIKKEQGILKELKKIQDRLERLKKRQ
ncbi:MAG TPA: hypothetical protein PLW88_01650 [Syntrophorhabdaceae bacterium]|nr:hypothetical protein [Syntrophorhabdaceae bacterium]